MENNKKVTIFMAILLVIVSAVSIYAFVGGFKGDSAYELAVKNGFEGSESEWLASLVQTLDYEQLYNKAKSDGVIDENTSFWEFYESHLRDNSNVTLQQSVQRSLASSVSILATCRNIDGSSSTKSGSGVIIKIDGNTAYILTNFHVAYFSNAKLSNTKHYVMFYEDNYMFNYSDNYIASNAMQATYYGGIKDYDLAILKLTNPRVKDAHQKGSIKATTYANQSEVFAGQKCYAIGNSLGLGMSVTDGVVSMLDEAYSVEIDGSEVYLHGTRFSALINGGNSGGGLFNINGQLIGIVDAKKSTYNQGSDVLPADGMHLALPVDMVRNVANQILSQCNGSTKTTPVIKDVGFTTQCTNISSSFNDDNNLQVKYSLRVTNISDDQFAEAGLAVDDIINSASITYVDGTTADVKFSSAYALQDAIISLSSGDKLTINYSRGYGSASTTGSVIVTI